MDEKESLSGPQRESVGEIIGAGCHLLELVNEILDLSQIESGNIKLNMTIVQIGNLLDECIALIKPTTTNRGIDINQTRSAESGAHIIADPTRLKQVLINLLSNAVKYNTDKGTVTVTCESVDNNRIRVSVIDTGPGISEKLQPLLFHPFERLGAEHSDIEGTGIGLAVTRHLVTLMEGAIGAHSKIGEGSTFWVEFRAVPGKD